MFIFNITNLVELVLIIVVLLVLCLIVVIKYWLVNKQMKRKMKQNREMTIKILDKFEEILAENNIKIPDKGREGNEDEACIYGTTYYDLEDSILEILNNKNNWKGGQYTC